MRALLLALLLGFAPPSFSIDVTVHWEAPTTRENGDVLTPEELGGFRIYLVSKDFIGGSKITGETLLFELDSNLTTFDIDNTQDLVEVGLVYLAMTAFDTEGLESNGSAPVAIPVSRLLAPGFDVKVLFNATPPPIPPKEYPAKTVVYSYYLGYDGGLIEPLPLSGVTLQKREPVYFAVVGDYKDIKYYCCKVGTEPHMAMKSGLVYTLDLSTLPEDGGLPRELYFDIVTHENSVLQGNFVNWQLVP